MAAGMPADLAARLEAASGRRGTGLSANRPALAPTRHGVWVHYLDAPPLDNDPEATLLVQVQGVIAEYERANTLTATIAPFTGIAEEPFFQTKSTAA
jgi:hypothetical protein